MRDSPMRFSHRDKGILYSELAKLLEAGFPMERALDTLNHHPLTESNAHFVHSVRAQLQKGNSISDSVNAIQGLEIDEVEKNLVHAGEKSGQLADVFEHLAVYYQRIEEARRTVLRGLVYPAAVLHLAVILFALPKAVAGEGLSAWLPALGTLLFAYALCAGAFYGYRTLQARSSTEDRTDRFLTHLPLLGKLRRMLALERFSEVFRIYLLSAFKPSEAIAAAGKASQSGHLLMESTLVSEQLVLGKNRLGPLLLANGAFPKDFAAGMSTAEESGTLDKELQRWANHYSTQARDAFSQFEIWLPRLIYVIISAFLTWKIVSWYYGYFDSISSLL